MTYPEYLECAKKHLQGCKLLFESYTKDWKEEDVHGIKDMYVWIELYYLSGYIIEGLTVYTAYKDNNWPEEEDIRKRFNLPFTESTGLDFYSEGGRPFSDRIPNDIIEVFDNRKHNLSVVHHSFQNIVKTLLNGKHAFDNIPYFGTKGEIDDDVLELLDKWKPDVRYTYPNQWEGKGYPQLDKDVIRRLLETCNTIYKNHI